MWAYYSSSATMWVRESPSTSDSAGIIITHTGSILEELHATHGYVLVNGQLMCSGSPLEIFDQVKAHGFAACLQEARTEKRAYDFVRQ